MPPSRLFELLSFQGGDGDEERRIMKSICAKSMIFKQSRMLSKK